MPYGVQEYVDAMEREVPGSRESMTRFVNLCGEIVDGLIYLRESRGKPDSKVLRTTYANFLKTAPYTLDQVAEALAIPERARKILFSQWSYLGPPTSRLNFTIFGAMMGKFLKTSAWIPRLRSHEFALALDSRIREKGGDVQYNTRAEEIQVEKGRQRWSMAT
jgi:prolycopene isomerase